MATYYQGNYFLPLNEQQVNAKYLYTLLKSISYNDLSIFALFGNWETESTFNPSIWQNLTINVNNGYGLCQWTPSTKYTNWCIAEGRSLTTLESAIARMEYELANGLQYYQTSQYPTGFNAFKSNSEGRDLEYLTNAWLYNYERPETLPQPDRYTQALYWQEYITNSPPIPPIPPTPTKKAMPIWMYNFI